MNRPPGLRPFLLILFSLACFWPGQQTIPPIDRDEARYAEASRQMMASGDFVDIRFQDQPRYEKPIGIYWLQSLAVKALGESPNNPIWPYRLPALLGAIGAVLATYWLGRTVLDPDSGFIAALLLATSLLLNIEARLATVDTVLLLCTTLALGCLAKIVIPAPEPVPNSPPGHNCNLETPGKLLAGPRVMIYIFWLALAAGLLLKGPVILLVTGLTILFAGRPLNTIKALSPALGLPLMLALAAPWYILITLKSHGSFWIQSLGHDLGDKLTAGRQGHGAWPGTYLVELPLAFWPASPFVLAALPYGWVQRHQPWIRFLLAAILPAWAVWELVPTKLPHYVLPLFPALAVLTAAALQEGRSRLWRHARRMKLFWLPGLAGLALLAYGVGFGLVLPHFEAPFIMRSFVAHRRVYPPDLQTGLVALAGFHEPSAVLWLGPDTRLQTSQGAAAALASGEIQLALVTPDEAAPFAGSSFTAIDTLVGYDYAAGQPVQLIVYRRNQDKT